MNRLKPFVQILTRSEAVYGVCRPVKSFADAANRSAQIKKL